MLKARAEVDDEEGKRSLLGPPALRYTIPVPVLGLGLACCRSPGVKVPVVIGLLGVEEEVAEALYVDEDEGGVGR